MYSVETIGEDGARIEPWWVITDTLWKAHVGPLAAGEMRLFEVKGG